jgi:hypothetical protein
MHLTLICYYLGISFDWDLGFQRWGKYTIKEGVTLRSRISELRRQSLVVFKIF